MIILHVVGQFRGINDIRITRFGELITFIYKFVEFYLQPSAGVSEWTNWPAVLTYIVSLKSCHLSE